MPQTLKCPSCAAPLQYDGRSPSIQCEYCNNIILMPEESRPSAPPSFNYSSATNDPFANFAPQINLNRLIEINDLTHRGRKIEAIKLFRETFDVGLKEAKEAVERLERGEAINLAGQQRIMAFHEADVQNQWYGSMNRGEMVINVGTTGNVMPGSVTSQTYTSSRPLERPKPGCISAFIGQFGCLLFAFFWIAFMIMMLGPLIYPNMVLYTAPILCEEGYQEAVAERVSYYSTGNFEGENIVLLHCIYEAGSEETPHPMLVMGIVFAVPMAILTLIAFGLAFIGRMGAVISS
jgi:DNA-directed RNA polymerase subunit RPC12/RpoP